MFIPVYRDDVKIARQFIGGIVEQKSIVVPKGRLKTIRHPAQRDWRVPRVNQTPSPRPACGPDGVKRSAPMDHTYSNILIHYVFGVKHREKLITETLAERLYPYMAGIARENGMKTLAIGGTKDHVHILLSLPTTISIAKAIQLIKGGASKWIHDTFPEMRHFAWQEGYGAFSIGVSQAPDTIEYIARQKEHHRVKTFQEEYAAFLKKHGMDFDREPEGKD